MRKVDARSITPPEARRAGYETLAALLAELDRRDEGEIYRIELGPLKPDPRLALRNTPAAGEHLAMLRAQLQRLDSRAAGPAWTRPVLEILSAHEGVRAGDLCGRVGQEKMQFKRNVRKLKNLGLTESLGTGYRLSPRGRALLETLQSEA